MMEVTSRRLILASGSPRRHEILEAVHIPHEIVISEADESLPEGISPADAVQLLSARKAASVLGRVPAGSLILAADTVVSLHGEILGKPRDRADAIRMLTALSGNTHSVLSGITVTDGVKTVTSFAETFVHMRSLSAVEIEAYTDTGEPFDKAGAYGIQERAALFVTHIEGDYFNIVGLPVCLVGMILQQDFGYSPAGAVHQEVKGTPSACDRV